MTDPSPKNAQTNDGVNLTNCDREPIHIPGKIQSHGFLIAVNNNNGLVSYVSENIQQFLKISAEQILNKNIKNLIAVTGLKSSFINIEELLAAGKDEHASEVDPIMVKFGVEVFHMIINYSGDFLIMDFETVTKTTDEELQKQIGVALAKILDAKTLNKTLQFAARQVKEIINYDRVMIYKFHEDGHGEVIAEEKNNDLEPFMGLHYPATDIPRQARELYKINLVRIIAEVNSTPAALLVTDDSYVSKPLDLTHSTLRAVSPIHIEYLQNMGVQASFSISLLVKGELWGLIACHNYTSKFIDYKSRNSAKLIGKILSSSLEFREEEERKDMWRNYQDHLQKILSRASKDWNIEDSLVNHSENILNLTNATGAALFFENNLYKLGTTPTDEEIMQLCNWLKNNTQSTIYHTNSLSMHFAPATNYKEISSGLLSCSLSKEMGEFILWFKPEQKKTVNWAGNPDKPVEIEFTGEMKLSPRRSFAVWQQEVEGVSQPWLMSEIGSAMKLREELLHIINQKANQVRKLNEELKKAYNELDTFSFTISHDLKTPLASIKNYTEILLEDFSEIPDEAKKILGKIIKSADRMNLLIREVLSYSRIDRLPFKRQPLNMAKLIENVVIEIQGLPLNKNIHIQLKGTPAIQGDETMIYQVFLNMVGNAVKYSSKALKPEVVIEGKDLPNEVQYKIQDNGIGIDMNYGNEIFDLFKRLENARNYEGSGVGLAIVKRIIEKHKGRIWYESEGGNGTIFYIAFSKAINNE